jgi:hypothetical protein
MSKVLFQGRFFDKEKDTVAKWIHKNEIGQKRSQYINRSNHFASIAVKVLSTMLAKITDSSLKIYSIFYVQIEWVYYLDKLGGR